MMSLDGYPPGTRVASLTVEGSDWAGIEATAREVLAAALGADPALVLVTVGELSPTSHARAGGGQPVFTTWAAECTGTHVPATPGART